MSYRIRNALIAITAGMLLGSGAALAESAACKADLNGDLVVNFADLAVLKSVFFQRCNDPGPTCGDDVAQGPTEECDDGNVLSGDGCSSTCAIEVPLVAVCGDGFADRPERCDDGNLVNGDGCSSTCQIERPTGLEDRGLTVFDHGTGLEWEKKTDDGGIHDKDNLYSWSREWPWDPDGTAFTVFLAALNAGVCYADHCDWRLSTVSELLTIVDCSHGAPCVAPIFGPTQSAAYWSSSSFAFDPGFAEAVNFLSGFSYHELERFPWYVRAVRSGP